MENNTGTGLQHVPGSTALVAGSRRAGLIARGRRDAAGAAPNGHYSEAVAHFEAGRLAEAAASFRRAAEGGHAESQYLLSTMLEDGEGLPQDSAEATLWEGKAAAQGHGYAEANVSFRCYSNGDLAGAFEWCRRAANRHLPWAQFNLGLMFRKGEGVERDDAEAARNYALAAAQSFPEAQRKLAELYALGQGVRQSDAEAANWYRRAAEQGDAEAQFQLGLLHGTGQGVDVDYVVSREWIRQAARQGHAEAVHELKRREYRDA